MTRIVRRPRAIVFVLAAAAIAIALVPRPGRALENGLARTPPMGWNSWNKFACDVNEKAVRDVAAAMVSSGMRDAGYQYVVIDDCWQIDRDAQGNIVVDAQRFPAGIAALAEFVHSQGLKFGIYSDAGTNTCAGRPGSWGYEFQDARQYAAWGVDYLKYDWCNNGGQNSKAAYSRMRDALAKCGRPIVFSICEWGSTQPWLWAGPIGNLWRTTGDITDTWDTKDEKGGGLGVVQILDLQAPIASFSGPGHWNDPDMLEVGNGGMSLEEYRSHFSLWCLLAAPLMAGNDIATMAPEIRDILINREVIAVDQDPLGKQGARVRDDGDTEVWARPLADGSRAVILLNRGSQDATIAVAWPEIGYTSPMTAQVRDLWLHRDMGRIQGGYKATVKPHGVAMIRITP